MKFGKVSLLIAAQYSILDFLDDWTKDVFKTAVEIDQRWVIDLAADRQEYICQSQSLNVFFPANVSKQELHAVSYDGLEKEGKNFVLSTK